jgi:hypothetical protein
MALVRGSTARSQRSGSPLFLPAYQLQAVQPMMLFFFYFCLCSRPAHDRIALHLSDPAVRPRARRGLVWSATEVINLIELV